MLTHVVLFKFKPGTSDSDVRNVEGALRALPGKIGEIKEFRVGRDVIRSERSYDLALVSGFDDLEAMQRYQVHPEHQNVVAAIKPIAESIIAVDFPET